MPDTLPGSRFFDPAALVRLKNMGLAARLVVEGLFSGQHRSPHRGFSVEFAEHRQYTPGVDPRHIDWKVFARRDRVYIKQYEEQTNLRGYLLLDTSASMGYRHDGDLTKLDYGCYCAAALAYLMQTQHDAFGLITYNDAIQRYIPARQGRNHLRIVLEQLEGVAPAGRTDLPRAFHELAERMTRRALVVVLSDLFSGDGDVRELIDALSHLRHRKHEVVVLQVLDRAELAFPFRDATQIEDVETTRLIAADAEALRNHYLEALQHYLDAIRGGCLSHGVEYALADTSQPFDMFLGAYLTRRHRHTARSAKG